MASDPSSKPEDTGAPSRRKRSSGDERRSLTFTMKVTRDERSLIHNTAREAGCTNASEWVMALVREAVARMHPFPESTQAKRTKRRGRSKEDESVGGVRGEEDENHKNDLSAAPFPPPSQTPHAEVPSTTPRSSPRRS